MPGRRPHSRSALALTLAVTLLAGGACTGERPELAAEPEPTTTSEGPTTTTTEVASRAQVAEAKQDTIDVFATESSTDPQQQIAAASATSAPEIPLTFLVRESGDDRLEVYLPTEPAGSTGWVRSSDVTLSSVPFRIEVDVSDHRLRVHEGDEVVVDVPAGIGPDRPTPSDGLYLKELVQPPEDDGPYGAYVYGLSGSPMVRAGIEDGEGVVGIHGTDDTDLPGTDMEAGSIAINEDVLTLLVDEIGLPLGTPVEVSD